jgi:hypothetical protein
LNLNTEKNKKLQEEFDNLGLNIALVKDDLPAPIQALEPVTRPSSLARQGSMTPAYQMMHLQMSSTN